MNSSHYLLQLKEINWTTPVLYMIIAAIFMIIAQFIFSDKLQEWGFSMQGPEDDIKVDENLPNFFKAVKLSYADELVMEI